MLVFFKASGTEAEKHKEREDEFSFSQEEKADGRATIPESKREAGRPCLLNSPFLGNGD